MMRTIFCLATLLFSLNGYGITVVECLDSGGTTWFRDKCPPEMSVKSSKTLQSKPKVVEPTLEEIAAANPVVLFSAPQCEACLLARSRLDDRAIPYSEKDASEDAAVQAELAELTGGPLTVPTITVGEQQFTGYDRNQLDTALNDAGYP